MNNMRCLFVLLVSVGLAAAENGLAAWLRYAPLPEAVRRNASTPAHIVALNSTSSSPVYVAGQELQKGIQGILNQRCSVGYQSQGAAPSIVVGTLDEYNKAYGNLSIGSLLAEDGYWLSTKGDGVQILGQNERGALYGTFRFLTMLAQGNFTQLAYASNPAAPIRWTNEWDNMDGSIERGFAGNSIFFANGGIVGNLTRAASYARLLASVGINGIVVNNVNANATLLTPTNIQGLGKIADVFRPYGVQLGISLDFASPTEAVSGRPNLTMYDPLDSDVIQWWANVTSDLYAVVPDLAGFLVKADSEGQPGPAVYNRTLAEGANLFASALKPYGGIVMFRAFVYDQLNESDWKADRANAAVDFFEPLDGQFDDNVVIQIKYGPIDFQVREPTSPLFGRMPQSNVALELEIAQEYLGQQCHLAYLPPLWKTVLDFDLRVDNKTSLVRDIITGQRFDKKLAGSAGVVNVGLNDTWLGSHLSMSNLYAYGRLAWDWTDDPKAMLQDWTRLTFGLDSLVLDTVTQMSMDSWPAYEKYSGNLGVQTLTDILYTHFGPNPQSQDGNGWGQWTRASNTSIGMDRTVSSGTGYSGQYPPQVQGMYEDMESTPDDLLLWFHHVPYTHPLRSGKTVIQHFYDAHYDGAAAAQRFVAMWASLRGRIDARRFREQLFRQVYQAGHALVWRDAVATFYHDLSGIADAAGRVGRHPHRVEAESMALDGYVPYAVAPFETASNATAVVTATNATSGRATARLDGCASGTYDVAVAYFDLYGGDSRFEVLLNNRTLGRWTANLRPWIFSGQEERMGKEGLVEGPVLGHTPSVYLDGHSATRVTLKGVEVARGDVLTVVGVPDGTEPAPLDYVALLPEGVVD